MLPISVLVPTRNSMPLLPQHIESMRSWLDLVQEIVAVDSHSTDGTLEMLQGQLGSRARVMSHPPGLYQSWNFGLSQCVSEFVYISTVGDGITRQGLEKLHNGATRLNAAVVISPPSMVDMQGAPVAKVWPVHALIEALELGSPVAFDGSATQLFAFANLRRGILGSSASNLYRAEILQRFPFRTDFGTAGDLAWGLEHSAKVRLAIVPERFSTFVFHPKSYSRSDYAVDDFAGRCLALAHSSMSEGVNSTLCHQVLAAWDKFLKARQDVAAAKRSPVWFLKPGSWRAHRDRSAAFRALSQIQRDAIISLREQVVTPRPA